MNTLIQSFQFPTYFHATATIYYYTINSIMYFKLDNDDMESSKHCSIFISLIFILKCYYFGRIIQIQGQCAQLKFLYRVRLGTNAGEIFNWPKGDKLCG